MSKWEIKKYFVYFEFLVAFKFMIWGIIILKKSNAMFITIIVLSIISFIIVSILLANNFLILFTKEIYNEFILLVFLLVIIITLMILAVKMITTGKLIHKIIGGFLLLIATTCMLFSYEGYQFIEKNTNYGNTKITEIFDGNTKLLKFKNSNGNYDYFQRTFLFIYKKVECVPAK